MNHNIENEGKNTAHKHSPLKHAFHMILCCGLPILIMMALPFVASISPGFARLLGVIAPFICPIMMGGMLLMMFRSSKKGSCCDNSKNETN